jgi:hypothetical protein
MLGLVITLVASVSPALPAADVTCVEGPFCDGVPLAADEERTYATPAVIDCRSPLMPLGLSNLWGECDGTPYDASYRISHWSDGEQRTLVLRAARRDRRSGVTACDGLPPRGAALTLSDAQPVALFASAVLVQAETCALYPSDVVHLPSRFGDPPDRPPRV